MPITASPVMTPTHTRRVMTNLALTRLMPNRVSNRIIINRVSTPELAVCKVILECVEIRGAAGCDETARELGYGEVATSGAVHGGYGVCGVGWDEEVSCMNGR
jgi:hypothetical protein